MSRPELTAPQLREVMADFTVPDLAETLAQMIADGEVEVIEIEGQPRRYRLTEAGIEAAARMGISS